MIGIALTFEKSFHVLVDSGRFSFDDLVLEFSKALLW
jgi:hypothetical protein